MCIYIRWFLVIIAASLFEFRLEINLHIAGITEDQSALRVFNMHVECSNSSQSKRQKTSDTTNFPIFPYTRTRSKRG